MARPLLQHAMGRYYQSVLLSKSSDRVLPASSNKFQHTHRTRDLTCAGVEHESETMHRCLELESTLEQESSKACLYQFRELSSRLPYLAYSSESPRHPPTVRDSGAAPYSISRRLRK